MGDRLRTRGVKCFAALVSLYLVGPIDALAGQEVSIVIQPSRGTQMRSDSRVLIEISLKNTSGRLLKVKSGPPVGLYVVDVKSSAGTQANLTAGGKYIYDNGELFSDGHFTNLTLQPGQTILEEIQISDIHDMHTPGTYTIQLMRNFNNSSPSHYIQSNAVNVTVTK